MYQVLLGTEDIARDNPEPTEAGIITKAKINKVFLYMIRDTKKIKSVRM